MDDVTFGRNGRACDTTPGRSLISMNALFLKCGNVYFLQRCLKYLCTKHCDIL